MFERLLVPLDGSRLAEAVLPAAVAFAERFAATLLLFHVVEESPPSAVHGEHHLMTAEEAQAYLRDVVARLARPDVHIETDIHAARQVDVARSITEHAEELHADLVMLCAHGRGGLRDVLVGSIAQQVIQRGTTPVFLVPATMTDGSPFACRHILVPLDGTAVHEPALPVAVEIARAFSAALHLLTVVATAGTLSPERAATGVLLPSTMAAILDLAQRNAVDYLQKTTQKLLADGLKASAEVRRGDVAAGILAEIEHFQADMLILATHGRSSLAEFWSGGVTPKILSHSPVPVLLVRVTGEESPR